MSNVYFTSDTHFGHEKVALLRGYSCAAEHDAAIVEQWNSQATKRDVVWVLGDLTNGDVRGIDSTLRALLGTSHLVLGNHDAAHPIFRNGHNRLANYVDYFASASTVARLHVSVTPSVTSRAVLLSHFPFDGEGARDQPDRHVAYRLRDTGIPLLHGHTHDDDQHASLSLAGTPMFHVGWDAHRALVPLEVVREWMRQHGR